MKPKNDVSAGASLVSGVFPRNKAEPDLALSFDRIENLAMQVGELSAEVKQQKKSARQARSEARKLKHRAETIQKSLHVRQKESESLRQRLARTEKELRNIKGSIRWRVVNALGETRKKPAQLPRLPALLLRAVGGADKKNFVVRSANRLDRSISYLVDLPTSLPRKTLAVATYTIKSLAFMMDRREHKLGE